MTERCDNRCFYCRPGGEACRALRKKEMSLRQIYQIVKILAKHGITNITITGGEPLKRDDIPKMVQLIKSIEEIDYIRLITRSPRVGEISNQLKEAGLSCLNFSLDSLDPYIFFKITRHGELNLLLQSIERCFQSDLDLKFNMVVLRGINSKEIPAMIDFVGKYKSTLKLLDLMNMPNEPEFLINYYFPFEKTISYLKYKASKCSIDKQPGGLGTPMPKFEMPNGATVLVKDARVGTWYGDTCDKCDNFPCQDAIMALRLTNDGCLQRCLLREDNLVNILEMVENIEPKKLIDENINLVLSTFREAVYYEKAWDPFKKK
ncbi:MAG: radical SAM protein [Candidatus Nealsonbacteria bacterium]